MSHSIAAVEWKPQASAGKRCAPSRDFGGLAEVEMQMVPRSVVGRASFSGCLNEALRHDGRDDCDIAEDIAISAGYMSKFIRGVGESWAKRLVRFMRVTRSLAPLQWIADQMGCDVVPRSSEAARIAELEAELAAVKARRAA